MMSKIMPKNLVRDLHYRIVNMLYESNVLSGYGRDDGHIARNFADLVISELGIEQINSVVEYDSEMAKDKEAMWMIEQDAFRRLAHVLTNTSTLQYTKTVAQKPSASVRSNMAVSTLVITQPVKHEGVQ